jgi:hypothetical protein
MQPAPAIHKETLTTNPTRANLFVTRPIIDLSLALGFQFCRGLRHERRTLTTQKTQARQ